jgi:hypothetical protein
MPEHPNFLSNRRREKVPAVNFVFTAALDLFPDYLILLVALPCIMHDILIMRIWSMLNC